jgi:amino acid transporter
VTSERRSAATERARSQLRRGSERVERAEARISRGLGEPALFAILLSSVVSSLFMVLGLVADDALGLTPIAFLASGVFFVLTMATYVEGSSLHPERGGASTFARYAFDELWSFIAGWAILLDYLIVMAIGAIAVSDYLSVFWGQLDWRRSRSGRSRSGSSPPRTCAAWAPTGSAWSCGCRCSGSCCCWVSRRSR